MESHFVLNVKSRTIYSVCRFLVLLAMTGMATNVSYADVTLTVGSKSAQPGSAVSVPVQVASNGQQPATVVVEVQYDAQKLQFMQVQPGAATAAASKELQFNEPVAGRVRMAVSGGLTGLANGVMANLAFQIKPNAVAGNTTPLMGADASAADVDALRLAVTVQPGGVTITAPCTLPATPGAPVASDGDFADYVRLTWTAVADAAEYEIYRNTQNDPAASTLLATVSTAVFDDTNALPPVVTPGHAGMQCPPVPVEDVVTPVIYYYWIKAVNDCGASGFSAADTGFRGETQVSGNDAGTTALAGMAPSKSGLTDMLLLIGAMGIVFILGSRMARRERL